MLLLTLLLMLVLLLLLDVGLRVVVMTEGPLEAASHAKAKMGKCFASIKALRRINTPEKIGQYHLKGILIMCTDFYEHSFSLNTLCLCFLY